MPSKKSKSKYLFIVAFLLILSGFVNAQTSDIAVIKQRVLAELSTSQIADKQVENILSTMNADGSFVGIDYADLSTVAGFPHQRHIANLLYLSKAYQTKISTSYHSQQLKETIIKGLDYWVRKDFIGDNWHDNQITTPTIFITASVDCGLNLIAVIVTSREAVVSITTE